MMFGYSVLLSLGLAVSAPWWMARMVTTKRYREGLRERLGRVPERLRGATEGKRIVWMHAVSVGEVLAVSRLVSEFEAALNALAAADRWRVVVSTTTRTGQALARERFGAERVFYLPLDFAWAVRAWVRALRPAMVVLAESELWPRLMEECRRYEIPVAVVNARMSDRSFRRAWRVRRLWAKVLGRVSLFLAQSEETAQRLIGLGARDGAVQVSGNLKYDVRARGENAMTRRIGELLGGHSLVVAGSTLENEEEMLLEAWGRVLSVCPDAMLLIAPRHPERFERVAELLRRSGRPFLRCAQLTDATEPLPGGTILLLDTIGDLASIYSFARVAFVGGSLVAGGGHNPLEPAQFGVPVLMGPSFENFRDVVVKMLEAGGIRIVRTVEELGSALAEFMTAEGSVQVGQRGHEVFEREGGATARSVEALLTLVAAGASRRASAEVSA